MTREESRWAQIVYWEEGQVLDLHRREQILADRNEALVKANKSPRESWDVAFIECMQAEHGLSPFWPTNITASERDARWEQWRRAIYPIWSGLMSRSYPGAGTEFSREGCFDDMDLLHRCDIAIFRSGFQPMQRGIAGAAKRAAEDHARARY